MVKEAATQKKGMKGRGRADSVLESKVDGDFKKLKSQSRIKGYT